MDSRTNAPSFSIVTVVRSDLEGLIRTRKSLEEQDYSHWTHIIIDGGSNDGTSNYVDSLNIENTVYVNELDSGIYSAMNKGWKLATPESYVFFLNASDVFASPKSLEESSVYLSRFNLPNWACSTHEEIEKDGSGWICKLVSVPSVSNQLFAYGYRSHQAVLMKASFIRDLGGFDENYRLASDWDLIVRALLLEQPITWRTPIARFELGGISTQKILDAHYELVALRRKYLAQSLRFRILEYFWMGMTLREIGHKNIISSFLTIILKFQEFLSKNLNFVYQFILGTTGSLYRFFTGKEKSENNRHTSLTKLSSMVSRALFFNLYRHLSIFLRQKLSISQLDGTVELAPREKSHRTINEK